MTTIFKFFCLIVCSFFFPETRTFYILGLGTNPTEQSSCHAGITQHRYLRLIDCQGNEDFDSLNKSKTFSQFITWKLVKKVVLLVVKYLWSKELFSRAEKEKTFPHASFWCKIFTFLLIFYDRTTCKNSNFQQKKWAHSDDLFLSIIILN